MRLQLSHVTHVYSGSRFVVRVNGRKDSLRAASRLLRHRR